MKSKIALIMSTILLLACNRYDKTPESLLGMRLGMDADKELETGKINGLTWDCKTFFYYPTDLTVAFVLPFHSYDNNGIKVLSKIDVYYQSRSLEIHKSLISIEAIANFSDKEELIELFEKKYGKCSTERLGDDEQGASRIKSGDGKYEWLVWHIGNLSINLNVTRNEDSNYDVWSRYMFCKDIRDDFEKNSKNHDEQENKKNKSI